MHPTHLAAAICVSTNVFAQAWVDRGVPDLAQAAQRPGAYDARSDRWLVVDDRGGTWAANVAGGAVIWSPLPDRALRQANPSATTLFFDDARGRLSANTFSPTGTWEWDGDEWRQVGNGSGPNFMAFDAARGVAVGIVHPHLGTSTPVFERQGTDWIQLGFFAVAGRGPIAYDPVRRQVLMHGRDGAGVARTHTWDGTAWTLVASNAGPDTVSFAMATDAARSRIVAHGGVRGSTTVNDTWEWDGTAWSFAGSGGIPPVESRAIGYHAGLGAVIAYGGRRSSLTGIGFRGEDLWQWNGAGWTRLPAVSPGWRRNHAIAHDVFRGATVLFGGNDGNGALGDTWTFDDGGWQQQATAAAPAPRHGHSMAFDSVRANVLLFGGTDGTTSFADLWRWDGIAWSPVAAPGTPAPRSSAALAFDAARDRLVMYGGLDPAGWWRNDTWEWDGSAWSPRFPSVAIPPLAGPLMAFDAARGLVLLHGRNPASSSVLGGNYEWDGIDYADRGGSHFQIASAVWYDPLRGMVMSDIGSPFATAWNGAAWQGTALPLPFASPVVFDAQRGEAFAFDGRRTRLATAAAATSDDTGSGCGAVGRVPTLAARAVPHFGESQFGFDVHAPATVASLAAVLASTAPGSVVLGSGCTVRLAAGVASPLLVTDAAGYAAWRFALPTNRAFLGLPLHAQAAVLDAQAPLGFALTQAIRATLGD